MLDTAELIVAERPDSAQILLETLYPYSNLSQQQRARCGILLAMAKLRQSKSFASDSLLDNSIAYFNQKNDSAELFRAYQLSLSIQVALPTGFDILLSTTIHQHNW